MFVGAPYSDAFGPDNGAVYQYDVGVAGAFFTQTEFSVEVRTVRMCSYCLWRCSHYVLDPQKVGASLAMLIAAPGTCFKQSLLLAASTASIRQNQRLIQLQYVPSYPDHPVVPGGALATSPRKLPILGRLEGDRSGSEGQRPF